MAEKFGCCSKYTECSDNAACLFLADEEYSGCQYRKNLESGRIFYGKNAGKVIAISNFVAKDEQVVADAPARSEKNNSKWVERRVYIDCYNRLFNVGHLSRNGFTYQLNAEELELVRHAFENAKVPFLTELVEDKCVMEGDEVEPANARILFKVNGSEQEFVVGNYNSCPIRKRIADKICQALKAKGFVAKVEMFGSYSAKMDYDAGKSIREFVKTEVKYEQVSIYQIAN